MVKYDIVSALNEEVAAWAKLGNACTLSRFILRNGTRRDGSKRPAGLLRMEDRQCFRNAYRCCAKHSWEYRYVEGMAVSDLGLPIHHAWCEDAEGRVIDPTWRKPETCSYMGVEIAEDVLHTWMIKTGVYGVLDTGFGLNYEFIYAQDPELEHVVRQVLADLQEQG